LKDEEWRKEIGEKAEDKSQEFRLEIVGEKLEEIYTGLLK